MNSRIGWHADSMPDLVRGKWEKFSREMLITLAAGAGLRVSLKTVA